MFINRPDRLISHLLHEQDANFYTPKCDKHLGIWKRDASLSEKRKYKFCINCGIRVLATLKKTLLFTCEV